MPDPHAGYVVLADGVPYQIVSRSCTVWSWGRWRYPVVGRLVKRNARRYGR